MNNDHGSAGDPGGRSPFGDGIWDGLGMLSAMREALEETIQEACERGDLSRDRAREVVRETLGKAQSAADEVRGRLDLATQSELERIEEHLDALSARIDALEAHAWGRPISPDEGESSGEDRA